jgi:hypothetical protein
VRHVRMLGLCLVAAFAMSAVAAMPALAKEKYSANTWAQFKYCPYNDTEVQACTVGLTSGGAHGGFFQLGRVEVPLRKPVALQGGLIEDEGAPGAEAGSDRFVAAANGGETLESPELAVKGGLKLITKKVQEEVGWPQALKESFKEAIKNKETALDVKIETAGNSLYENPNALNVSHLLDAEGNTFELPLKTTMSNSWLAKLGGGPCTVGNEAHPILQDLTSAGAGNLGTLTFNEEFTVVEIENNRLVDFNWPVEEEALASGCGGSYESYVDRAIDVVTESAYGTHYGFTVLSGNLYTASRQAVQEQAEAGNL